MQSLPPEFDQLRREMRQLRQENAWLRRAWESQKERSNLLEAENKALRAELKQLILAKDAEINRLKAQLQDKEAQRQKLLALLYKPKRRNEEAVDKTMRRQRQSVFLRPKPLPNAVTERHLFMLRECPDCHCPVGTAADAVVKYSEDITLAPPPTVVEYTITRHWCRNCRKFVKRDDVPVVSRIGPKTMGYILYARYRLGLPLNKIQSSLYELYGFTISEGEIVAQLHEAENLFGKDYQAIAELIREATRLHADETSWRVMGEGWWLWVFTTPEGVTRFILENTRGQGVAKNALGANADRVITSDFYPVYLGLPVAHQYCWVHLLRDAKALSETLYTQLAQLYREITEELEKEVKARDPTRFEQALEAITLTTYPEESGALTTLQERMHWFQAGLLTCLNYSNVSPNNNRAERTIRPQVVMRKIFGGCRSLKGAKTHAANSSVITTYRAKNSELGFFDVFLPLIHLRSAHDRE